MRCPDRKKHKQLVQGEHSGASQQSGKEEGMQKPMLPANGQEKADGHKSRGYAVAAPGCI
jgi:hypothetical protein